MKCPLLMLAQRAHDGSITIPIVDCVGEECAWFESATQVCTAVALYRELRLLVGAAGLAADRLSPTKE